MIALAVLVAAVLGAETHTVTMPGRSFSPARTTVVVGDTVTWRNTDSVAHDVRAADGSFESGALARFRSFSVAFPAAGPRPYLCTIHPFMRGQVDVVGALLRGPEGPVVAGESVRLEGRATPGAAVTLEGAPGRTVAAADGSFSFTVTASAGTVYRALTAAGPSPPVAPAVAAGVTADLSLQPGRRWARVRVRSTPVAPGLVATLQRYSRERFMWRTAWRARLDAGGRARFRVPTTRRGRMRVVLGRTPHGSPLAVSHAVRVRDGVQVADPVREHDPH